MLSLTDGRGIILRSASGVISISFLGRNRAPIDTTIAAPITESATLISNPGSLNRKVEAVLPI